MAGRLMPLIRLTTRSAAASIAPVLPAETKPCERPSATVRAPTTIEESGMVLTAAAGSS